ncbi:hypothetical protein ABW19_dt0202202 [Dactylella cylindrospora]|nr:hypothetical protein ABW19_dt0202202 [Dactylella cylindrospora]
MSSTNLVSLEDTPLATNKGTNEEPSLLDAMESEQSQLETPSLAATTTTTITSEKTPLSVKTSQRKSVDFHHSVSNTSSPLSPRHAKRQSLSFPINVTPSYYPSTHYRELRSPQHTRTSSEIVASPVVVDNVEPASDPVGFLTVLAGQERRVLELKEELLKADAELEKLKRKWAMHEATRKITDSSTVEQMRNLELADESKKHARRKSMGVSQKAKRTTFHNTKHQRTLSLLSPDRTNFHSFPQPLDVDEPLKPKRASTMNEQNSFLYESGYEKSVYEPRTGKRIGHQEALIATGKQMAEDFKEGLWTFIEDLRQATVGEEMAANGQKQTPSATPTVTPLKKKGSKASLKLSPIQTPATIKPKAKKTKSGQPKATKLVDIGDDFWSEMDPDGPLSAKSKELDEIDFFKEPAASTYKKGHVKPESVRWSSSTIVSEMGSGAMSPGAYSTPRTSTSSRSRSSSPHRKLSEPFPERNAAELFQELAEAHSAQQASWGMITAPLGKLQKTATAVLTQIEKGLAPPPPASQSSFYDLENARIPAGFDKSKKH